MADYRKKPVVIQAEQFDAKAGKPWPFGVIKRCGCDTNAACSFCGKYFVETLEGPLVVSDGDYIIRGTKGEFYPCKPDIFETIYDAVVE